MKRIILLMIVALLALSGLETMLAKERTSPLVIVLDPGHDSSHAGASDNGLREEVLNLKIAKYCLEELRTYNNVEVHMTRYAESCPHPGGSAGDDNLARVKFAEGVNADVYISLHINSEVTKTVKGVEIFYPNSSFRPALSTEGENLATSILNELTGLGLNNRGVRIRNAETSRYSDGSIGDYYQVIREAKKRNIPGIIVEHAFISNTSDAKSFLSTEAQLKALGVADATGIAKHYGLRKGGYEKVFDAVFYADKYEDVKKLYGYDEEKLLNHFIETGMKEGRQGIADFDPYAYRGRYEDLASQYEDQMWWYYSHYMEQGKAEGRSGVPVETEYTVTFMCGDETISTQIVSFGHGATRPDVGKEGMYTVYDRQFYCITEDTMVYITYEPIAKPEPTPDTEEEPVTEEVDTETESVEESENTEAMEDTEEIESEDTETESMETEGVPTEEVKEDTEVKDTTTDNEELLDVDATGDHQRDSSWFTLALLILGALACIGIILVLLIQLIKNKKDIDTEA